ncbi:MAG: hypothetical protein IIZ93_01525 [Acidaminococcaceae bacterium]|nr:hypothetical protein [Acidaminococcaceae bacterium]
MAYNPVWKNKVEIGTTYSSSTWSYSELAEGIESMTPNFTETNNVFHFLADDGFAHNEVTGAEPTFQISGRRVAGDAAQDYIAGLQFALGTERNSSIRITAEGKYITCDCTITDIVAFGGNSTDVNQFSCTIRFNGKPTVT